MGFKRELFLHFLTTATLLALFSWHEDNYYRVLLKKGAQIERQEEVFFHQIQQEVTQIMSELADLMAKVDHVKASIKAIKNVVSSQRANDQQFLDSHQHSKDALRQIIEQQENAFKTLQRYSRGRNADSGEMNEESTKQPDLWPLDQIQNTPPPTAPLSSIYSYLHDVMVPPPPNSQAVDREVAPSSVPQLIKAVLRLREIDDGLGFFVEYFDRGDPGDVHSVLPTSAFLDTNFDWEGIVIQRDEDVNDQIRHLALNVWIAPVHLAEISDEAKLVETHFVDDHLQVPLTHLVGFLNRSHIDYLALNGLRKSRDLLKLLREKIPKDGFVRTLSVDDFPEDESFRQSRELLQQFGYERVFSEALVKEGSARRSSSTEKRKRSLWAHKNVIYPSKDVP